MPSSNPSILSINAGRRTVCGRTLFTQLTLTLNAGDRAAITGPNGAGKSTLLRCIVGDDALDEGVVKVGGLAVDSTSSVFRAAVSADLGDDSSFLDLTVTEHLGMLAAAFRLDTDIAAVIEDSGLGGLGQRYPHALSTGQKRRFGLAAAFMRPCILLVLDEPEFGLDAAGQQWVSRKIAQAADGGAAVLLATHSPQLVAECNVAVSL